MIEVALGDSAARSEFENYIPALFFYSVILVIFHAVMTPTREVESGTLKRLHLTCVNSFEHLGGIIIWLVLIAFIEAALTLVVAVMCGFLSQGSLWLVIINGTITRLSKIGAGLIVAAFSKTTSQAFVIANFPLALFMFMKGVIYPIPRTPFYTLFGHSVAIYDILPTTHAVLALYKIFTWGLGTKDIVFELAALSILSLIYFGSSVWAFQNRKMKMD
jgi:ABC-2 type transport system permease protein